MTIISSSSEPRFAGLLRGDNSHVWDQTVSEGAGYVVVPTRGSIIPNWLLIIPRQHSLNFAVQKQRTELNPYSVVKRVAQELDASTDFIWFEHGASHSASEIGCGVDHAHLHLILRPEIDFADFTSEVFESSDKHWETTSADRAYDAIDGLDPYYIFGSCQQSYVRQGKSFGRQFFRKVIAKVANRADTWDYNLFPHENNVLETLSTLSKHRRHAA